MTGRFGKTSLTRFSPRSRCRGERASALTGRAACSPSSTGGAQASVGLPIFFGAATYSAADARITLNGVVAPPRPSIIYCIAPVDLDRAADDLTMLVDGVEYDLVDVDAGNVAARLLAPAALVGVLWRSGEARLLEVLETRPQDYSIRVFWSDSSGTIVPAGEASFDTPTLTIPTYTGTRASTSILFIGVPNVAPNIAPDIIRADRRGGPPLYFQEVDTADYAGEITAGVAGKWVRTNSRVHFAADSGFPTSAGSLLFIESAYL